MARVFTPDIIHTLVPEATFATTPTTGATRYELPLAEDAAPLEATATDIKSNTKRPNRESNGSQRGMVDVSGALNMRLTSAPVVSALFEYALSGVFASKVLKGGSVDKSFTVISKFAADMVKFNRGCMVKGFTIDAKANDGTTVNFDVMGVAQDALTSDSALTVTVVPGSANEYKADDVRGILVAGTALSFSELSFQTALDRTQSPVLSSSVGLAFGVNGTRTTTVTLKAYRDSFAVDTLLTGAAQGFQFDVGTTGNGFRFSCPAMYFSIPKDEVSNGSAFVTITGTAGYDPTLGSGIQITQL
jgi:hypothetical protein